jgi:hypothetical protein
MDGLQQALMSQLTSLCIQKICEICRRKEMARSCFKE